jgi:hypothetical protein
LKVGRVAPRAPSGTSKLTRYSFTFDACHDAILHAAFSLTQTVVARPVRVVALPFDDSFTFE